MDSNAIGSIIEIPDKYTVIIDVGDSLISIGEKIVIYEAGPTIVHPDTQEELGQYDFIKDIVEVIDTSDRFSVCKKISRKKGNKISIAMTPLLQELTYETEEELNVNPEDIKNWKMNSSAIAIGDPVKKLGD